MHVALQFEELILIIFIVCYIMYLRVCFKGELRIILLLDNQQIVLKLSLKKDTVEDKIHIAKITKQKSTYKSLRSHY